MNETQHLTAILATDVRSGSEAEVSMVLRQRLPLDVSRHDPLKR